MSHRLLLLATTSITTSLPLATTIYLTGADSDGVVYLDSSTTYLNGVSA